MTIFLVRHGETEWNRIGRYQGWSDSPLTEFGRAQAEAIGKRLAALPEAAAAALVASPLGRARHTAEIVAECLGRTGPPVLDARLREVSLGSWDGLDHAEVHALAPQLFVGEGRYGWYFQSPDGERWDEFAGRLAAWLAEAGEGPLIAVCHGVVTRVVRGLYAGLPRAEALRLPVPQDCIWRLVDGHIDEIPA
ncbi:MAG TPA: histidine phosphatase family protein [Stellaceae bacterium]|nr:histidine phosphatase family protein [Stellaceae bacterium]